MNEMISRFGRLPAYAGMAGGAAWIATGALHLTGSDELRTSTVEGALAHVTLGLFSAALLLTAPAVLALARHASNPRGGQVAAAGQVLLAIASTVSNVAGHDPTFFLVAAPVANAMWLFGDIALAVSLRRTGQVPAWVAFGLPASQVFALPLSIIGGPVVAGGYWVAVAYLLSVDGMRKPAVQAATA